MPRQITIAGGLQTHKRDQLRDAEGSAADPSPVLITALLGAPKREVIGAVAKLRTREGAKRLAIAEMATHNRQDVLSAIAKKTLTLPDAPEERFFDGTRMRESLTPTEQRRLHRVQK